MSSLLLTQVSIPERVSAEEFLEWMIAEPQTIVWLPTLHRLAVSETGTIWVIPGYGQSSPHDQRQDSPLQTNLAWLIRCLLYG